MQAAVDHKQGSRNAKAGPKEVLVNPEGEMKIDLPGTWDLNFLAEGGQSDELPEFLQTVHVIRRKLLEIRDC